MPSARDVCNTLGHPCLLAQHSFSSQSHIPSTLPPHHPTASRRHRLLFASGRRGAAAAAAVLATADGAPAPRRRPSDPVHLLTFDDLSCAVPVCRRFQWLRRLFACGRSSAAPAAQDVGVTAAVAVGGGVADVPGYKQIVKGASGVAANGELVGVLGPSGAASRGRGAIRLACVRLLKLVASRDLAGMAHVSCFVALPAAIKDCHSRAAAGSGSGRAAGHCGVHSRRSNALHRSVHSPVAGSGKTTLLAIVAGSAEDLDKRSVLTGSVLMDGQPIHSAQRRKVSCRHVAHG